MWVQRDGKPVQAQQFAPGQGRVRGQEQAWDNDGAYYVVRVETGPLKNKRVRLTPGDFVCLDEEGLVCDVQSDGRFRSEHVMDASVQEAERAPAPAPIVVMTTEELEREREKLIADAPESPVKRKKSTRKKAASTTGFETLPTETTDLEEV